MTTMMMKRQAAAPLRTMAWAGLTDDQPTFWQAVGEIVRARVRVPKRFLEWPGERSFRYHDQVQKYLRTAR